VVARRRLLGALMAFGLVAAGCAIPTEQGPSTIPSGHVPFGLLNREPPSTTTTQPRLSSLVPVKIFLLNHDQQLTPVERYVFSPAPLTSVLAALVAGPTASDASSGLTTAITSDVGIIGAQAAGSVVTVNLNRAFGAITGAATEQAVAQIVATVAAQNGLGTGVVFEIDGVRSNVPVANGATVPGPVYLLQFATAPTT
jgi:spore germination protein GerM